MAGKTVAVTGATGFIASQVIKDLLERGYIVRGTARDPDDISKVGHLWALPGAKERLTLYKADLLEEGSFDAVVDGVDGVFHTASPVTVRNVTDPQVQYINPALKGTLNLLQAATKSKSVKRVVLTSSAAATFVTSKPITAATIIDESWWSEEEVCRANGDWYALSKTLAEKAAWDFVKDRHFDLVAVNPGLVLGTILQPTLNLSSAYASTCLSGATTKYINLILGIVGVKEVSLTHILAYEHPEAEGRYLVVNRVMHHRQMAELLGKLYPGYPVPTEPAYDLSAEFPVYKLSNKKAQKLGVEFRPVESVFADLVASLQQHGWLEAPKN